MIRSRGISIIEMLISIAILAIIVALLIPTVSAARRSANVARCASNLRQIGVAVRSYQADNRRLPQAPFMPPPFVDATRLGALALSVNAVLSGYISGSSQVYKCPSDEVIYAKCAAASANGWGTSYDYSVNTRADSVRWPPPWEHGDDRLMSDYSELYQGDDDYRLNRLFHRKGWNSLASDGSVRFVAADQRWH